MNNIHASGNAKMRAQPQTHTRFVLVVLGFMMLLLVRDVLQIELPNIIFTVYAAVAFLLFTYEECVAFALMFLAFGTGTAVNYILGVGLLMMAIKKRDGLVNHSWIPMLLLIVWEALHAVVPPFSVPDYLRYVICMLMFVFIAYDDQTEFDIPFVLYGFMSSVLFVCSDIFWQTLRIENYDFSAFTKASFRYGDITIFDQVTEGVTTSTNQNAVGEMCLVCIAILMVFLFYRIGNRKLNVVLMVGFATFGFLTLSKTFFVAVLLVIFLYIFAMYRAVSVGRAFRNMLIFAVIIGAFLLLMQMAFPNTINTLLLRFSGEDALSERDVLFRQYHTLLMNDRSVLWFGVGNQEKSIKTGIHSPHNSVQELLVNWGIVGAVLMLFALWLVVQTAKRRTGLRRIPLMYYLPMIGLLFFSQAGQLFGMNERMLYFAVMMLVLSLAKRKGSCA